MDETGTIDIWKPTDTLVLPAGTEVEIDERLDRPELLVREELAVFAHPSDSISIRGVRETLGVAIKHGDGQVTVATYGEYVIQGHGGTHVSMSARVPPDAAVKFRDGLSGRNSAASDANDRNRLNDGWI